MKKLRVLWLVPALAVVACVAMAIPSSPVYLPILLTSGGHHDGHSTRYWINALHSSDSATRRAAVRSLGAIGPQADAAVPELSTMMLEDPNRDVRIESALALTKMGPALSSTVPALTQALNDPEPGVRMNAVLALMHLKKDARPAIPELTQAIKNPENKTNLKMFTFTIQEAAVVTLGYATAGTSEAVPTLMEALRTTDRLDMCLAAARALGEIGPEARPAVPHLRGLLKNSNIDVRETAQEALQKIEGTEPAAAP